MGSVPIDPKAQAAMKDRMGYADFMAKNGGDPSDQSQYSAYKASLMPATGGAPQSAADQQAIILKMQADKAAAMKAQGLNPDGSPIAPDYNNPQNADGSMKDGYKLNPWENVNANTGALEKLRGEAMRGAGTNSAWGDLMLQKQGVQQAQNADNAAAGANNNMLSVASRLAQTGGLGGGSRERLQRGAQQNAFIGRQQVERQGQTDRLGIQTQDENNRQQGLRDLQGMDNQQADIAFKNGQQAANINQFNVGNMFKSNEAGNNFAQDKWKKQMEVWGAGKTADAQQRASGGGGKK
jgi:hypothetical protein